MENSDHIPISTPFDVGRVNCYLFTRNGLTLLDPGPATETAYDELSAGLADRGFTVGDVDRILITHPHMDHFGLAGRIVEESDARAVAHKDAELILADPASHFDRERAFFEPFLRTMGVPEKIAATAVGLSEAYADYQEPLAVDRALTDGDRVDVGVDLAAVHTPGHAPGSVCFVPTTAPVAFTGDHVLERVSPNPLLTIAPGSESERTRSLPTYLDSLRRIRSVDAEVGYGGHGPVIEALGNRIEEIRDHHRARKEHIAEILDELESASAYDVMEEMFPDLPATEVFPGMSEVIGHLDLLEDKERVDVREVDGIRRYSLC